MGEQRERKIKRFGIIGYERDINLRNSDQCSNLFDVLPKIFDAAIFDIIGEDVDNSMIGVSYQHPELNHPILIPFRPIQNVNGQSLADKIEQLIQSNANVRLDDQTGTLRITKVTPPVGEGNHDKSRDYTIDELRKRQCVIQIKNSDKYCLARALVVAMTRPDRFTNKTRWNKIRLGEAGISNDQINEAMELMKKAGLEHHDAPCGINELKALQDILPDYQIKVFSADFGHKIMFEGNLYFILLRVIKSK